MSYSESYLGFLHIIIGPMFSGKSTRLINEINTLKMYKKNILIINSNKDSRVANNFIKTHNNIKYNAIKLDDVLTYINTNALPNFQPRLIYNSDGSFKLDVPPDYEAKQRTYRYKIIFSDGQEEVSEEITLEINDLSD